MIDAWLIAFTLVLARVGTFVAMLPLLGGRMAPRQVKLGLAFALAVQWLGSLESGVVPQLVDATAGAHWLAYGLALGREVVLGAVLGQGFGLFLLPARIAGEYIGQEMGLALASLTDPGAESSATVMGQVFETFGILVFFGLDGHHVLLGALHGTFLRWPVGGPVGPLPVAALVGGMASAQEWGLLLAEPLGACLFVTTVVLALMARTAPQLNILSVGFAMKLAVGLVAAVVLMPEMGAVIGSIFSHFVGLVLRLI